MTDPDTQTREVTTPTEAISASLAAAVSLDPASAEIVGAAVRDGELVVELRGERLGGSE